MSERIIDGITCRSHVYDMRTGETHDYTPADRLRIYQTYLSSLSTEEIEAMPHAPKDMKPELQAIIRPGKRPEIQIL